MTPSPEVSAVTTTFFHRLKADGLRMHWIAKGLAQNSGVEPWVREEAVKIMLLADDQAKRIDAAERLVECQQTDLRELRDEGLRMAQEVNAMRAHEDAALRAATTHNDDASISAPMPIPLSREPRRAASGE